MVGEGVEVRVPRDDQLTRDVDLITDLLMLIEREDGYDDKIHQAACARVRAAFGLDEEGDG